MRILLDQVEREYKIYSATNKLCTTVFIYFIIFLRRKKTFRYLLVITYYFFTFRNPPSNLKRTYFVPFLSLHKKLVYATYSKPNQNDLKITIFVLLFSVM